MLDFFWQSSSSVCDGLFFLRFQIFAKLHRDKSVFEVVFKKICEVALSGLRIYVCVLLQIIDVVNLRDGRSLGNRPQAQNFLALSEVPGLPLFRRILGGCQAKLGIVLDVKGCDGARVRSLLSCDPLGDGVFSGAWGVNSIVKIWDWINFQLSSANV